MTFHQWANQKRLAEQVPAARYKTGVRLADG